MSDHVFKDFRAKHGMSQAELGIALGLEQFPQGRISHYETGRRPVPTEIAHVFVQLARSYGESYTLESVYPANAA